MSYTRQKYKHKNKEKLTSITNTRNFFTKCSKKSTEKCKFLAEIVEIANLILESLNKHRRGNNLSMFHAVKFRTFFLMAWKWLSLTCARTKFGLKCSARESYVRRLFSFNFSPERKDPNKKFIYELEKLVR